QLPKSRGRCGHWQRLRRESRCRSPVRCDRLRLDRRLFDRTASKLALTSDGEILLTYAQCILALEEEVKTRLGHPEPEGLGRLGAPEYFDPGTLASVLAQFNSRYPAIDLEIPDGHRDRHLRHASV